MNCNVCQAELPEGRKLKRCTSCQREYQRGWSQKNSDKQARYSKAWHEKTYVPKPRPPVLTAEERKGRQQAYYAANTERLIEHNKQYRAANPDSRKEADKKYRESRKDDPVYKAQRKARKQAWRARRKGVKDSSYTPTELAEVMKKCGEQCLYCGGSYEHDDHFIALKRGGGNGIGNIVPACASCNSSKKDSDPFTWMRTRLSKGKLTNPYLLAAFATKDIEVTDEELSALVKALETLGAVGTPK